MIVQLTSADVEATAGALTAVAVASAAVIRWARTPTKERLIKVENQVSEIYGFLIKHTD